MYDGLMTLSKEIIQYANYLTCPYCDWTDFWWTVLSLCGSSWFQPIPQLQSKIQLNPSVSEQDIMSTCKQCSQVPDKCYFQCLFSPQFYNLSMRVSLAFNEPRSPTLPSFRLWAVFFASQELIKKTQTSSCKPARESASIMQVATECLIKLSNPKKDIFQILYYCSTKELIFDLCLVST